MIEIKTIFLDVTTLTLLKQLVVLDRTISQFNIFLPFFSDFFSIIEFSDNVTEWRKEATAVNDIAIQEAKNFVDEIKASGIVLQKSLKK